MTSWIKRSPFVQKAYNGSSVMTWQEPSLPYVPPVDPAPVQAPAVLPQDDEIPPAGVSSPPPATVLTRFRLSDAITSQQDVLSALDRTVDLSNGYDEAVVPGSVRLLIGGEVFSDRNGVMVTAIDHSNNAAITSGSIDYATGVVTLTSIASGAANTPTLESLVTEAGKEPLGEMQFRVPSAPVKVDSLQIRAQTVNGENVTAVANSTGIIDDTWVQGYCDYQSGVVDMQFGAWVTAAGNEGEPWYNVDLINPADGKIFKATAVWADSMFYNATSQTFIPLDADILGLDPVRLPQDGRVPIYADGDVVVVLNDQTTSGTFVNATDTDLGRTRIAKITVRDVAGVEISDVAYSVNLDTGIISWVNLSGISQPLTIVDRIEDMAVLTDVQITGTLTLSQPLSHDFPLAGTLVSNAVIYGDLFAHTTVPFDQQTWTGVWSDVLIGSGVAAQYNNSGFPIAVDNASAIEERWIILFSNTNTVDVIGENVGQILTDVLITGDIAPINPNTSQPYFTIPLGGWGGGWAAGNLLRFNTLGAGAPLWLIQSVAQGDATDPDLTFCVEIRGDRDS